MGNTLLLLLSAAIASITIFNEVHAQTGNFISITTKRPTCVSISSSRGTRLSISYSTPDLIAIPHDDDHGLIRKEKMERMKHIDRDRYDGMQERMDMHHKKRRDMEDYMMGGRGRPDPGQGHGYPRGHPHDYPPGHPLASGPAARPRPDGKPHPYPHEERGLSNISITIQNVKFTDKPNSAEYKQFKPTTFPLLLDEGNLGYTLSQHDYARICIQSLSATVYKPTFFSMRVKESSGAVQENIITPEQVEEHIENSKSDQEKAEEKRHHDGAHEHMRWMERELNMLINRANSIHRTFKTAKDEQGRFHLQMVQMRRTFSWFPFVQLLIMVVTAVINVKTWVAYLKKKGVIF